MQRLSFGCRVEGSAGNGLSVCVLAVKVYLFCAVAIEVKQADAANLFNAGRNFGGLTGGFNVQNDEPLSVGARIYRFFLVVAVNVAGVGQTGCDYGSCAGVGIGNLDSAVFVEREQANLMCAVGKLKAHDHGRGCSLKLCVYRKRRTVGHVTARKNLLDKRVGLGAFVIVYRVNIKVIDVAACRQKQRLNVGCRCAAEQSEVGRLAVGRESDAYVALAAAEVA